MSKVTAGSASICRAKNKTPAARSRTESRLGRMLIPRDFGVACQAYLSHAMMGKSVLRARGRQASLSLARCWKKLTCVELPTAGRNKFEPRVSQIGYIPPLFWAGYPKGVTIRAPQPASVIGSADVYRYQPRNLL